MSLKIAKLSWANKLLECNNSFDDIQALSEWLQKARSFNFSTRKPSKNIWNGDNIIVGIKYSKLLF